jgi:ABC-type spermidine/putrescine transport system permease subunit I
MDIYILLFLLGVAVLLPYLRKANLPLIQYPEIVNDWITFDAFYTTLEIAVLIIAIQIVIEIVSALFDIFDLKIKGQLDKKQE